MRRAGFVTALLLAASALATGAAAKDRHGNGGENFSEPSDAITADDNFARLRAARGARDAFRATAQLDAETFAPGAVRVADYLKRRTAPYAPHSWQIQHVWMSCDGSYAVTYGAWQEAPAYGWYATVWHRQKNGGYKWVLDDGGSLKTPLPQPEMISAGVADCPARRQHPAAAAAAPAQPVSPDYQAWRSDDGTLDWTDTPGAGQNRSFTLRLKQDGALHEVLRASSAPGG